MYEHSCMPTQSRPCLGIYQRLQHTYTMMQQYIDNNWWSTDSMHR